MTAERALLERAAKAAGSHDLFFQWEQDGKTLRYVGQREWNPLADDGDALRLAVKLHIHIEWNGPQSTVDRVQASPKSYGHLAEVTLLGSDPYAATRLAIVRAAASGGEGG